MSHWNGQRLYLDANAFIQMIEGADESHSLHVFGDAAKGFIELYTSEFTLAELLVIPLRGHNNRLVVIYEELFASDKLLSVVPVDRSVLRHSAEVRATFGNKAADAIHIATALACDCPVFVSDDLRIKLPVELRRLSLEQMMKGRAGS